MFGAFFCKRLKCVYICSEIQPTDSTFNGAVNPWLDTSPIPPAVSCLIPGTEINQSCYKLPFGFFFSLRLYIVLFYIFLFFECFTVQKSCMWSVISDRLKSDGKILLLIRNKISCVCVCKISWFRYLFQTFVICFTAITSLPTSSSKPAPGRGRCAVREHSTSRC